MLVIGKRVHWKILLVVQKFHFKNSINCDEFFNLQQIGLQKFAHLINNFSRKRFPLETNFFKKLSYDINSIKNNSSGKRIKV